MKDDIKKFRSVHFSRAAWSRTSGSARAPGRGLEAARTRSPARRQFAHDNRVVQIVVGQEAGPAHGAVEPGTCSRHGDVARRGWDSARRADAVDPRGVLAAPGIDRPHPDWPGRRRWLRTLPPGSERDRAAGWFPRSGLAGRRSRQSREIRPASPPAAPPGNPPPRTSLMRSYVPPNPDSRTLRLIQRPFYLLRTMPGIRGVVRQPLRSARPAWVKSVRSSRGRRRSSFDDAARASYHGQTQRALAAPRVAASGPTCYSSPKPSVMRGRWNVTPLFKGF